MATRAKRAKGRRAAAKRAAPKAAKRTTKRAPARKPARAAKTARPAARKAARRGSARAAAKPARRAAGRRAVKRASASAMPQMKPGAYVHMELYTDDPKATEKFYSKVFGWQFQEMAYGEGMQYTTYRAPDGPGGGLMDRRMVPQETPSVLNYLLVEDLDKAAKQVQRAGGKLVSEKITIPGVGWSQVFMAPGGVVQAMWQANPDFQPQ